MDSNKITYIEHKPIGKHILLDLIECQNIELLNNPLSLEKIIEKDIEKTGSKILETISKKFDYTISTNQTSGYTLLAIISESHFAAHTYPEHKAAFVEIFTCGETHPEYILKKILNKFQPLKGKLSLKWRYLRPEYANLDLDNTFDLSYIGKILVEFSNTISITKYSEDSIIYQFQSKQKEIKNEYSQES